MPEKQTEQTKASVFMSIITNSIFALGVLIVIFVGACIFVCISYPLIILLTGVFRAWAGFIEPILINILRFMGLI